jgi:outer membrane immunogenic protein
MHIGAVSALALVMGLTATQADAQSLRGFRAEGQAGITSFHSEGNSKSKIGWGAAVGVDAFVANSFVLGVEGTYWDSRPENHTIDGGGLANHKMFQEWGLGVRAGVMVTPATLVYGKVAYVRDEQRKEFIAYPPYGTCAATGPTDPNCYYYDHRHVHGIQWGGGVEQNITDMFYVKAEGRYSDYKNHTHALTGLLGVGVLLGGTVAEAAPPPPPPPPPPAPERG